MVMQWTVNPPPSGTTGSIPVISTSFYSSIAQLVEHHVANVNVTGSNPVSRSIFIEAWQSPVYCSSLENCRLRDGSVSSNLTASTNLCFLSSYNGTPKYLLTSTDARTGHEELGYRGFKRRREHLLCIPDVMAA